MCFLSSGKDHLQLAFATVIGPLVEVAFWLRKRLFHGK
jgi:ACR3 family arsenite efflux pump ArsB